MATGKRLHSRAEVSIPIAFRYGKPSRLVGTLVNLGEGGAALLTLSSPGEHNYLFFDLVLPDGTLLGQVLGQIIDVTRPDEKLLKIVKSKHPRALRSRKTKNAFLVRVRFMGLTEAHRAAIRKYVKPLPQAKAIGTVKRPKADEKKKD